MDYKLSFSLGRRVISPQEPTYFIADIGANHDGQLARAVELIKRAKAARADCAKFQHFRARDIVSREGFEGLKVTHQAQWPKSVYETYEDYSINRDWNVMLADVAKAEGIDFMTTPYDFKAAFEVDPLVKAYKIGSGDITYLQLIRYIANRKKPVFLATGASSMQEVETAVEAALLFNPQLCLMQCNTNYTGDDGNFAYVNLKVLRTFAARWPGLPLGLSDHTAGYVAPLGAVALGACVIEKHFTDDPSRNGPDHKFALSPTDWTAMVQAVRRLEAALGDGHKIVEDNEVDSRVVQRRAIRLKGDYEKGTILSSEKIEMLRPCPNGALTPAQVELVMGKSLREAKKRGDALYEEDVG